MENQDSSLENDEFGATRYNNTYSTYPFTAHAVSVIEKLAAGEIEGPFSILCTSIYRNLPCFKGVIRVCFWRADTPLFLYLPYQNVHWPLEAPQEFLDMFAEVPDNARQHVCAMAKILDEGVGNGILCPISQRFPTQHHAKC